MEITEQDFTDLFGTCFYSPLDAWRYFLQQKYPELFQNKSPEEKIFVAQNLIDKNADMYKEIGRRNNYIYQFQEAHQKINRFMMEGNMEKELNLDNCVGFEMMIIPEGIKYLKANHLEINDLPTCLPDSLLTLDLSHSDIKNISYLPPNLKTLKLYHVRSLTKIKASLPALLDLYTHGSSYEKAERLRQKQFDDMITWRYYDNNFYSNYLRAGQ
jgi:hypothetical protein